jgi:hypothetical protein
MTRPRDITPRRLSEPYASIVERVTERDRSYFAAHPGAASYIRDYIPGEFPPESLAAVGAGTPQQNSLVEVRQLAPGVRVRRVVGFAFGGGQ